MFVTAVVPRTILAVLIVNVLWIQASIAISCPASSTLVRRELPRGKEERCVLRRGGKHHGPFQTWYGNGTLKQEGSYRYGQPQGRWTYYYPNGQKRMEGSWRFGKAQGAWTYWHENGGRESAGQFRRGKRDGSWSYWNAAGEMRFQGDWRDGALDLESAQTSAPERGDE